MNINLAAAEQFLAYLAFSNEPYSFQIIPKTSPSQIFHGQLEQHASVLIAANYTGAGVFVTVNQTDSKGRKAENITTVRAVFADLDGAPLFPILAYPFKPHIVVESSPDKYHAYWLVEDFPLDKFKAVQQAIAKRFAGDTAVCDLPRLMRLPGFYHQKGDPFQTRILQIEDFPRYSYEAVAEGLSLQPKSPQNNPTHRQPVNVNTPLPDGERTKALTQLIGRYIAQGFDDDAILDGMRLWNARNLEALPEEKLLSTLTSIRESDNRSQAANDDIIGQLNRQYAVVLAGSKCVVLKETRESVAFLTVNDFKNFNSNLPRIAQTAASTYWLNSPERRSYNQVVFDPAAKAANDSYNLWKGFSVEPIVGDCSLYLSHLKDNIASGDQRLYDYILNWMSDAVQNPGQLPGVSLILRGLQGTGKGIFATKFGEIFGRHFKHVQSQEQLLGRFNGHLADSLLIFADEVVWGGNRQLEGALKTLITEKKRFAEFKGKDAIQVDNFARVIMATNNEWVVPAGVEERRFCVIEVGSERKQDAAYFAAIMKEMDSGGLEALLHLLLNRDLTGVEIRDFPKTQALLEQKELSFSAETRWWYDCLNAGHIDPFKADWPDWISTADLHRFYVQEQVQRGNKYFKMANSLIKTLKRLIPNLSGCRKANSTFSNSKRIQGYNLPTLDECRADFETSLGQQVNWEEDLP